jgi:hypothetical protein
MIMYGHFCDWFFANPNYLDHKTNKRAWTIKQRNQKFDFAVLGSSRAYGSFDMAQLKLLTNKSCINLGANGSGYVDNYLSLYLFLKNNNKIDTLFLQVDIYSLNSKNSFSNAFHTYQFLPYWKDSLVREGLSPFLNKKELAVWNSVPPIRYFKYNKYFSPKEVVRRYRLRNTNSPFDKLLGGPSNHSKDESEQDNFIIKSTRSRSFDDLDIEYLNKIIALSMNNNIKVIAYKAPELLTHQQSISNYSDLSDRIDSILKTHNILYIKPDRNIESVDKNFANPTHLSQIGRSEFTPYFAERITNIGQ